MCAANNSATVVFVHSSFRTGSTFVRSCFRNNPNAYTFQEVFNENLATMGKSDIAGFNSENWNSKHPLIAPYFLEFHSLVSDSGTGVKLYDRSMSYDTFFQDGKLTDAETAYITHLIEHARSFKRLPVITCTRSLGRVKALKNEFGGLHLVLYRNIFHQWCSYTDQWIKGNPGFLETVWLALNGSHNDQIARSIAEIYSTPSRSALDPKNFLAFVLLHLYLYARAADEASAIIDIDKISSNPEARDSVEKLIYAETGLTIDFGRAKQTNSFSLVDIGSPQVLSDSINAFPEIMEYPRTLRGKEFLMEAKSSLFSEYSLYSKKAGPIARAFADQLAELESLRTLLSESRNEVSSLRAHLAMNGDEIANLRAANQVRQNRTKHPFRFLKRK